MAIAFVQALQTAGAAATASGTTIADTTTAAVTAGNRIIGIVASRLTTSVTLSSVSGGGLTWSVDATLGGPGTNLQGFGIFSALAPSGLASGTAVTATISGSSTRRTMAMFEFSGIATATPQHGALTANAAATTGAITVVTLTGLTVGDLVIGGLEFNAAATTQQVTAGTGYTVPANGGDTVAGTSSEAEGTLEWKIAAAASEAITFSISGTAGAYSGGGVAYTAAAAVVANTKYGPHPTQAMMRGATR